MVMPCPRVFVLSCFGFWLSIHLLLQGLTLQQRLVSVDQKPSNTQNNHPKQQQQQQQNSKYPMSQVTCPPLVPSHTESYVESFEEDYLQPVKQRVLDVQRYLKTFRTQEFDGWQRTYNQVLDGMRHWKATRFVCNVQSGDVIYESACGTGLNIVMTLEILKNHGIENITVYGNEYLPESVTLANQILDRLAPELGHRKGALCAADSTHLDHIPDNVFDLVFTGYLTELPDPLGWNQSESENRRRYKQLCSKSTKLLSPTTSKRSSSNIKEWKKTEKLIDLAQKLQQDWHAKWVSEMIRITKPGKVIIIEQERESRCAYPNQRPDYLGLSQQWWRNAIEKYSWDVDPNSLDFEEDVLFHKRYHVMMRKRKMLPVRSQ